MNRERFNCPYFNQGQTLTQVGKIQWEVNQNKGYKPAFCDLAKAFQ